MSSTKKTQDTYHHGNLKQDILDTADKLYLNNGLEAISVRKISKELQVSPMAFYHYFKSLDVLIDSLVEKYLLELEQVSMDKISSCQPSFEKLYLLGEAYIMYAYHNPKKFSMVFNSNKHILPFEQSIDKILLYRVLFGIVEEIVGKDKNLQQKNLAALSAWSLVHGLATLFTTNILQGIATDSETALNITRYVVRTIRF